jgi:hypothetical protein
VILHNKKFDLIMNVEVPNMLELIKTKNIYIYIITFDKIIVSAYYFRKSCVEIEKDKEVLSCFASINSLEDDDIFIQGFKLSFWEMFEKYHYGFCAIESISHNGIIINNLQLKTKPIIKSPTAYFFYNFAYPTFQPEKCFIIH